MSKARRPALAKSGAKKSLYLLEIAEQNAADPAPFGAYAVAGEQGRIKAIRTSGAWQFVEALRSGQRTMVRPCVRIKLSV